MTPSPFDPAHFQAQLRTGALGRYLLYRWTTETTMTLARREAAEGGPHGTLVLAEEQTAGRGRRGRSFESPPAENLYFTLVLRCPPEQHRRLPLAVPVAVCSAVREQGLEARIKWPNDIWAGRRKLCGMLIDAESIGDAPVAYPGIGINVNGDPTSIPALRDIATSIRRELGKPVAREALLAAVCNELEFALALDPADLLERYRALSMIVGHPVTVIPPGGEPYGAIAVAICDDGSLEVEGVNGERRTVNAADISLRPSG